MKIIILFFLSLVSSYSTALLQTNLQFFVRSDLTNTFTFTNDSRIPTWADVHNTYNTVNADGATNDLTMGATNGQPYFQIDSMGRSCVMFPWGNNGVVDGGGHSTTNTLTNNLSGFLVTNTICYVVCASASAQGGSQRVWEFTSWGFPFIATSAGKLISGIWTSTNVMTGNIQVIAIGNTSSGMVCARNGSIHHFSSGGSGTIGVGRMGGLSGSYFNGYVYALLAYKDHHSDAQILTNCAYLAETFRFQTNYNKRITARGDSLTAGSDSSFLGNWSFDMVQQFPELEVINLGSPGLKIGTNGSSGKMYDLDPTLLPPMMDNTRTNYLVVQAGINDMNLDSISGAGTYGRLTNYAALSAVTAFNGGFVPISIPNSTGQTNNVRIYNQLMQSNYYPTISLSGAYGPTETRLQVQTDLTYFFTDGLHLVNAGYAVVATHIGARFNQQRRTTGFFAQ